jgi:uncharacterized protein (TIGR02466 family)
MINLFSTPIKIIEMPNLKELLTKIDKSMSSGFKQNFTDTLPKDEAEELQKIFLDEVELYLKELTNKKIDTYLYSSWVNHNNKYSFDTPHHHSGTNVIGVFYLRTVNKCGDLLLHDARGYHNFIDTYEKNTQGLLVSGRNYFRYTPRVGNLVLFPSYIVHSTEPNMSDDIRISLAMNFKFKDTTQFKPE